MKIKLLALAVSALSANAMAKTYDSIEFANNSCPEDTILFPYRDVSDNMDKFRSVMGQYQITQLSDGYVIMGGSYNYEVKKGSAGGRFCVSSTYEIRDQGTMERISDASFFAEEFGEFEHIKVIYSDGNYVSKITLPTENVRNGVKVSFYRQSSFVPQVNGVVIPGEAHFEFQHGEWKRISPKNVTVDELYHLEDENYVLELLNEKSYVYFRPYDSFFVHNVALPSNASQGQIFELKRESVWNVTVLLNGTSIKPVKDSTTVFEFNNGEWVIKKEKVITSQHDISAYTQNEDSFRELFNNYYNVKVTTSDGNWSSSFNLPNGVPNLSKFTLIRDSSFGTGVGMPNGTHINVNLDKPQTFNYLDGQWHVQFDKSIKTSSEIDSIVNKPEVLSQELSSNNIDVYMSDTIWSGYVALPESARDGSIIRFNTQATYDTTIEYSGNSLQLKNEGRKATFVKQSGEWKHAQF